MLNKIFIIIIFIPAIILAKTILVAESGADFTTIQEALNNAVAGDTILVREKLEPYFEKISFPKSGNEVDGHIVLMNYPNEHPIIDGTNYNGEDEWPQGLVRIINQSYIKVIGFEIRNIVVSDHNLFPAGVWLYGALSHVEILNNKIHTIQQNADDAGAHGLAVYGTHFTTPISDILIDGNEIYNCKLGWSESFVLNGNVENFIVSNNIVHDNNNIGMDFIGHEGECPNPELDQARNGLVIDNIVYNIDSRGNQAYGDEPSAGGFYVDGGKDIIIERNTVYNCNLGIEIASEQGGKSTSGIIVRNNLVKENIVLGIAFGGYDNQRGSTDDCKIINNTLYKNNTEKISWGGEILVQYYCSNNIVANNIIHARDNIPMINNETNTGADNIFNNNIYFTEGNPKWVWGSDSFSDYDSYKNTSGQEENSLYDNPMMNDPKKGDFNFNSTSPAIDNGKIIESSLHGDLDILGNPRIVNDKIDMGAIEYNEVTSIKSSHLQGLKSFKLFPAYPNPFNPKTNIKIGFTSNSSVGPIKLNIYNVLGKRVIDEVSIINNGSENIYEWNAVNNISGVYFITVNDSENYKTEKIMLLK